MSLAASSPVLTAAKVQTVGPRINALDYSGFYSDTNAEIAMNNPNTIQAFDLSFSTASYTALQADVSVQTGADSSYSFEGIVFNDLAPVVSSPLFHQAIANLWNESEFQSVYLGVSGYTTPALFPCQAFPTSCANQHNVPVYPTSDNLAQAVTDLLSITWSSIYPTNSTVALCAWTGTQCATTASQVVLPTGSGPATVWHLGGTHNPQNGPVFSPNWWWRESLLRVEFSDIIGVDASHIGLTFNLLGNGGIDEAIPAVFYATAGSVTTPGVYVPGTPKATCTTWGCPGYNTQPVLQYAEAADASSAAAGNTSDNWAMYSYGFSAGPNFVGSDDFLNSAYGQDVAVNMANVHIPADDMATNAVIYASSAGAAASKNRAVALLQLQDLSMFNIYFENILWGAYINQWAGYANIPAYGPDSGAGLSYTALNVYKPCYASLTAQTCTGGTFTIGLGDYIDADGGFNPFFATPTVYDVDAWENIFDSPLSTPPTGYTAPLKFMNWMTTSYTVKADTGLTTAPSPTNGWFDLQGSGALNIHKGEVITFNFQPNLYWSDGAPVTAADYNYSLWASGLAGAANSPGTDDFGLLAGPSGIMATYLNPLTPLTIQVYINSTAAWDLADIQVPMLPVHLWGWGGWNQLALWSYPTQIDTASNPATAACITDLLPCTGGWYNTTALPTWISSLPNLEVGTGPFMLRTTNEALGTALEIRNPMYYRPYWQYSAYNTTYQVAAHTAYTLNVLVAPLSYNPTVCTSADKVCNVPITDAGSFGVGATPTGWTDATGPAYQVIGSTGHPLSGKGAALTCSGVTSICTATIPSASLAAGFDHVIVYIPYTYNGQSRVWYQSIGIYVK